MADEWQQWNPGYVTAVFFQMDPETNNMDHIIRMKQKMPA